VRSRAEADAGGHRRAEPRWRGGHAIQRRACRPDDLPPACACDPTLRQPAAATASRRKTRRYGRAARAGGADRGGDLNLAQIRSTRRAAKRLRRESFSRESAQHLLAILGDRDVLCTDRDVMELAANASVQQSGGSLQRMVFLWVSIQRPRLFMP